MKRFLYLLCALAFCLALTPSTALAADGAPDKLYVGNQSVRNGDQTTYWTTNPSTGQLTKYTGGGNDWNVKYDPTTATLTLNGATIQGGPATVSAPYGSGIYVPCSNNQSVALTIELIGTNTITGYFGIYVNANQGTTPGADVSLVIKNGGDNGDNGILTVTGTGNSGLLISSGTGGASLTIKNASVDAKTTQTHSGYAGVYVQSGATATNSPNISLSVDGGSLTASGDANSYGIWFYVGSSAATDATTSMTVTDNAIVDARTGGINATRVSTVLPTPTPTGGSGIVFDGTEGTVYGDVTLDESLTVNEGETLTIPEGSTLDTNGNLTNNGIIVNTGGTLNGEPGGTGTVETTPTLTKQPESQTVAENATAKFTVEATGGNLSYQWQQSTDGIDWTDISGANSDTYTTEAATTDMNGRQYHCIVSNSAGSVTSDAAILTVNQHEHEWGEPAWTWGEDGKTATATFTCAKCGEAQNVEATITSTVTTDPTCTGNGTTTYTATYTLDGKDYTATKDVADILATGHELTGVAAKAPTCTEDGYEAYWKCERCGRYFSDADGKTPIPAPTVIKATGHQWGEPAWSWDGTTATATFTCKNDNSHTDIVTAAVTSTVTTDPTCTENGVTEYTATVEHDGTTCMATKNVADIPATGHDWGEDGHCTICDTIKPGFMPEIIQGDEATWTKGGGQPLSFTSNAAYADFQGARVDGQTLDPVHYTVERGSTIVTLKAAYLESLDPGGHTLDIVSSTGTATATFTITAKETQQPAKPADTDRTPAKSAGDGGQLGRGGSDIMPAVATLAILMASGLVLGTLTLRRGRR